MIRISIRWVHTVCSLPRERYQWSNCERADYGKSKNKEDPPYPSDIWVMQILENRGHSISWSIQSFQVDCRLGWSLIMNKYSLFFDEFSARERATSLQGQREENRGVPQQCEWACLRWMEGDERRQSLCFEITLRKGNEGHRHDVCYRIQYKYFYWEKRLATLDHSPNRDGRGFRNVRWVSSLTDVCRTIEHALDGPEIAFEQRIWEKFSHSIRFDEKESHKGSHWDCEFAELNFYFYFQKIFRFQPCGYCTRALACSLFRTVREHKNR